MQRAASRCSIRPTASPPRCRPADRRRARHETGRVRHDAGEGRRNAHVDVHGGFVIGLDPISCDRVPSECSLACAGVALCLGVALSRRASRLPPTPPLPPLPLRCRSTMRLPCRQPAALPGEYPPSAQSRFADSATSRRSREAAVRRPPPTMEDDAPRRQLLLDGSMPTLRPRDSTTRETSDGRYARRPAGSIAAARASEQRAENSAADAALAPDDKPISLNFQRAELGAVLNAFAQFTGLNIVASERVRGAVSLRLDKVPWRTAFDTLARRQRPCDGAPRQRDLGRADRGSGGARAAAFRGARPCRRSRTARAAARSSCTMRAPRTCRRLLTGSGASGCCPNAARSTADPRTNLLFVTDLEDALAQIAALLAPSTGRRAR